MIRGELEDLRWRSGAAAGNDGRGGGRLGPLLIDTDQALMEDPNNYAALIQIAELYLKQQELGKASLYLKQALALDPNNTALRIQLQSIEKALGAENNR